MWLMRGVAGLSVLVLAACGGDSRGHLPVAPRPELTVPPGEMSVRLLFMVNPVAAAGDTAADFGSNEAASRTGKWGTIGLAEGGAGLTISADFRNAAPGAYRLRLLDEASCNALTEGETDDSDFVDTIDSEPVRLPAMTVDANGDLKRDFSAGRLETSDFRGRAIVLFDGNRPVACGSSIASRRPVVRPSGTKKPEGASHDGGRPGDGR